MTYRPPYNVPEILKLRGEGTTLREIGRRVGISGTRVGQLIRASEACARRDERANALRQELRASSDLTRKLPVEDVLCLLSLSARAQNCLRKWCERDAIPTLSLLDLISYILHGRGAALLE